MTILSVCCCVDVVADTVLMLLASPSRVRYQHRALQRWWRACGAGETAGEHPHARDQHRSSIGTVIRLVIVDGDGDDDDDDHDDLLVVLVESSRSSSSSSSSSRAGARNAQETFLTRLAKTNYRSMQLRCELGRPRPRRPLWHPMADQKGSVGAVAASQDDKSVWSGHGSPSERGSRFLQTTDQ